WVAAVAVGVQHGGGPVEPLDEGMDASFGGQFRDSVKDHACAVELAKLQAGGEGVDSCHGDAAVGRLPASCDGLGVGVLGGVGGGQRGLGVAGGGGRASGGAFLGRRAAGRQGASVRLGR